MKRIVYSLCVIVLAGSVRAVTPTTYNQQSISTNDPVDSAAAEALFLSDLAAGGYSTFTEDFEGSVWDVARSPVKAASVHSKDILWHAASGDSITTVGDSDSYEDPPPFMIYSYSPATGSHPIPNTLIGESATKLYAIGFWADGTGTKGKIKVILDDTVEATFKRIIGYTENPPDPPEPIKETVRLETSKEFFGVYAPDGFNKFQLLEYAGEFDEVVLMWMRTFTFAYKKPVPSQDIQISTIQAVPGQVQVEFTDTAGRSNFALQAASNLLDPYGWTTLTNAPTLVTQGVYRITADQITEPQQMFRVISSP